MKKSMELEPKQQVQAVPRCLPILQVLEDGTFASANEVGVAPIRKNHMTTKIHATSAHCACLPK